MRNVLASVCLMVPAVILGCSLDRRPLVTSIDAGPRDAPTLDALLTDVPSPSDVPVPDDVPIGMDVPSLLDAPIGADVPLPLDAPTARDAPDAPLPPPDGGCTAGATLCMPGDILATCTGGSFVPAGAPCQLGCSSSPGAHCRVLVPANVSTALATATPLGALVIDTVRTLDTTTCSIASLGVSGVRVAQDGGGPTVCLFYVDALTVTAFSGGLGGYLYAAGNVPLVIVSRTNVTVRGVIDVSSYTNALDAMGMRFSASGAGAGTGGTVGGGGVAGTSDGDGGGGGGGFCGDGGDGAPGAGGATGGAAGGASVSMLVPLRGGAAGGRGSGGNNGFGGPGGGAFQLSVMGALVIDGSILAAGAGGFRGGATAFAATAGGGGGSGGGLFIEAHTISLGGAALVGAPGGGGASGSCGSGPGNDGQNGAFVTGRPAGGANPCGGSAGPGALGAGDTTIAGDDAVRVGNNGPGGGGGAGCIVFRSVSGTAPTSGFVNPRTTTSAVTSSTITAM